MRCEGWVINNQWEKGKKNNTRRCGGRGGGVEGWGGKKRKRDNETLSSEATCRDKSEE